MARQSVQGSLLLADFSMSRRWHMFAITDASMPPRAFKRGWATEADTWLIQSMVRLQA